VAGREGRLLPGLGLFGSVRRMETAHDKALMKSTIEL